MHDSYRDYIITKITTKDNQNKAKYKVRPTILF